MRRREWSAEVHERLGLPRLFPPIRQPGTLLGRVLPSLGVGEPEVFTVGSHDTASAVGGVPARDERFAYVSCGTWSLVGVEPAEPVTTARRERPTSATSWEPTARSGSCAT